MGIQVTFISEKKLQKEQFLAKYDCFFHGLMRLFWTHVRMDMCHVLHNLRTDKEGLWGK